MQYIYRIFFILTIAVLSLIVIKVTSGLFSNTATSTSNTFTASAVFPTITTNPTPTVAPGDVVINEIMWMGSNNSPSDEWIELKNTKANPINLTSWVVENLGDSGTPNITIPSGTIGGNSFFLISNSTDSASIINVVPDLVTSTVNLLNPPTGEKLILKNNLGTTIDTANSTPGWLAGSNTVPKQSMERNPTPNDGTLIGSWHSATLTVNLDPGATESASPKAVNSP